MEFKIQLFDKEEYTKILNSFECFSKTNKRNLYYNNNNNSNDFFKKLLKLSNNHCFYCGEKLDSNNIRGIYFEKEHIIDKKIFLEDDLQYKTLLHCKKNLIPICKNCNSLKSFKEKVKIKENIPQECNIKNNCMDVFNLTKDYNFDFCEPICFDLLNLQFYSENNQEKIKNLKLNYRVLSYFTTIFELLYDTNINLSLGKRANLFAMITKNRVEEEFINFIEENNLLNTYKLKNLIETIVLLNLDIKFYEE